jgi:glycosyltransferase involved in cell wall biosynthesis
LPEYGADRVLIEQARAFRRAGHDVYLFGKHFAADILDEFAGRCVFGPSATGISSDADTAIHVAEFLEGFRRRGIEFAAAFHGGWPYLSSIAETRRFCRRVIFVDFGVVPNFGQSEDQIIYLDLVRGLRRKYLALCDDVVSISEFIRDSQALADAPLARHSVIYLGGDHVDHAGARPSKDDPHTLRLFKHIRARFRRVVLQLGRFEPHTYKCSEQVFEIAEFMRPFQEGAAFCYLGDLNNHATPHQLRSSVFALGRPSDKLLFEIIGLSDLTFSPSLWEGFNLPLLEAQWLGKPCLVLDIGAHREVAWDDRLLCADMLDLRLKMLDRLAEPFVQGDLACEKSPVQKEKFSWRRMGNEYLQLLGGEAGRSAP